ncbi:arylesterase [Pseudomonadota bacterium]
MRIYLLLLLSGLFCGPALAAEPPTLLVVGDSLSAAFGFDAEKGWPRLLQKRLTETGRPYRVINASISGDTTQGGLTRLPGALARHKPEIVIIELGANDGLRGINLAKIRDNLIRMTILCQQQGARVLLLGMHLPPNYGPGYTRRFHAVYQEVATHTGSAITPFFLEGIADNMTLIQADGLHPTAEAQKSILDNLWPQLLPLLK